MTQTRAEIVSRLHPVISRKTINVLCMAAFLVGLVWVFIPKDGQPSGPQSMREFWDVGHVMLFFLACHLLYAFRPQIAEKHLVQQAAVLIGATLLAGGTIELLQTAIPNRTASFSDLLGNLSGAIAYLSFRHRKKTGRYLLLHLIALCLVGSIIWPPIRSVIDEHTAQKQFPLLAGFESPFETNRFEDKASRFDISREKAFSGSQSLRLNLSTQQYSGIWLRFMPKDWQGHSSLNFAVYNPQQNPIPLHILINDELNYSDRYEDMFMIEADGWTMVEIPLADIRNAPQSRKLDMTRIHRLGFYVVQAPSPLILYIDEIRLKQLD